MWLALLLLGCAGGRAALGTELAEPAEIEANGRYVHEPSGMVFPPAVLDFRRVEIYRYDKEGRDVSGGYNLERAGSPVIATVYVYPIPKSDNPSANVAASHFEEVKTAVMSAHPDAVQLKTDEVKVTQGKVTKSGLHALFRFEQDMPGGRQTCRSEAYLFTHGHWFIKYRLTYPEAHADQSVKDIKAFMETLKWPEDS
jgi:hypothetical protein